MLSLTADSTQLLCPVERGSCHRFQWCTMVLTKDPSWQSSSLCVHRCEVPHKVDCPRSSTVRQVHHQVRCVVVWHLAAGDYDEGTGALPRCVQAYTFCFCFQSNAAVLFRSLHNATGFTCNMQGKIFNYLLTEPHLKRSTGKVHSTFLNHFAWGRMLSQISTE